MPSYDPEQAGVDRHTWDRQKHETQKAFAAFVVYRDLGPDRSQEKAAAELGKSRQLLNKWSVKWSWVTRARDYDDHLDALRQKAAADEIQGSRRRHLTLARTFLAAITERLKEMDPDELPVQNLDRVLRTVVEIELASLGVPLLPGTTSRMEVVGGAREDDRPVLVTLELAEPKDSTDPTL